MNLTFVRTVRSPSSERYILRTEDAKDAAALDLHYLSDGSVAGTLIVLDKNLTKEDQVQDLLAGIDEMLLPMVSFNAKNLTFTVVSGKLIGNFTPQGQ